LHSIPTDASRLCLILILLKNSVNFLPDSRQFWDSISLLLEWAQPAAVVGLVPQLGADVVEGQDLQKVRVKAWGSCGLVSWRTKGGLTTAAKWSQQFQQLGQRWHIFSSISAHAEPWLARVFEHFDSLVPVP
jgi:hypothetical protein